MIVLVAHVSQASRVFTFRQTFTFKWQAESITEIMAFERIIGSFILLTSNRKNDILQ